MWQALSVLLLVGNAIQLYFMWKFDRDADAASAEAERIRETLLPTQEELIQAQDEIVKLDRELAGTNAALETVADTLKERTVERDEAIQSAEHWRQRHDTVDGIRQKLAESLAGRANCHQITLGYHDAKVVVSDHAGSFAKRMTELVQMDEKT